MNTVTAHVIKQRGISAVDPILAQGPVHIIKNNKLKYVVLTEEHYQEFLALEEAAYLSHIKEALADVQAGKVKRFTTAAALMKRIAQDNGGV